MTFIYCCERVFSDEDAVRYKLKPHLLLTTGTNSQNLYVEPVDGNSVKTGSQTAQSKEHERLRPSSAGHGAPTAVPPGPSASFPRPVYPVPLLSHVPMVRPPPQLHPNVVQRMLAQGIQPQQLGPALVQAGQFFCSKAFFILQIVLGKNDFPGVKKKI